ncbi:hypothetical protein GCM10010520_29690 [Rhizobium viscosum]|uniref:Uncharacterized protein n=1 Tax=Rhizobium viscosum TaxID=1673 RepID=A0ABR9J0T2_RHIVS|nr:hypothetical protein [Rhizobium viscosum]MBE1509064.1 hypothetical protein [Rhizobium viscosum]
MSHQEMTIADVLQDPLIRQMMDADGISLEEFEKLLIHSANMLFAKGQAHSLRQMRDNAASGPKRAHEVFDDATVVHA